MDVQSLYDAEASPMLRSRASLAGSLNQPPFQHPHTPPGSTSSSPRVKIEGLYSESPLAKFSVPGLLHLNSPRDTTQVRLPSLGEFDQGVEALARTHGPARSSRTSSPLPSLSRTGSFSQAAQPVTPPQTSWYLRDREDPAGEYFASRRGTLAGLGQYALAADHRGAMPIYGNSDSYHHSYMMSSPSLHAQCGMDGYPSPPPEGENRHINQKYTTEEGDFIIYAWHDKKMKWQRIKQEFAAMFGRTPERTVQGLQAWYYRMNQRIPIWDKEGWLIFENEDDLEPKHVSIKCRERDSQDKPMEPLGLAQRYPERAMKYSWVDPDLKMKSRDWAAKRDMQYRDRRERRRRKEHRRLKL